MKKTAFQDYSVIGSVQRLAAALDSPHTQRGSIDSFYLNLHFCFQQQVKLLKVENA